MKLGEGFIEVRPDTSGFKQELQRNVQTDASSVARTLGQALAGGAFLAGAKKATDAASALEQAVGGTAAVFGEAQAGVEEFARGAAESAGLSERAARELTSTLGGLLKGFGFTNQEAADLSVTLAGLGADLAATFGGTPEEAVQALGAALRGETDPLERFGIALNQTLVNQRAVELGLAATTSAVDQHAKAQATLSLITERSADAQGQFAREADTAAGQAAISAAKTENAAADLGENLLPIYTKLAETVGVVADAFGALPEPVQTALIALAGIAALYGPVKAGASAIADLAHIARTQLTRGLDAAATGAYTLSGNLGTIAAVAGVAGVALLAVASNMERNKQNAETAKNALQAFADAIREAGDVAGGTEAAVTRMVESTPGLAQALAAAEVSTSDLAAAVQGSNNEFDAMQSKLIDAAKAAGLSDDVIATLSTGLDGTRVAAKGAAEQVDAEGKVVDDAGDAAKTAAPKVEELADKLDINEQAAKDAAESVDKFREAVEKALQPLDFQGALDDRAQALADLASGIEEREQAVADARQRIKDLQAIKPEDRPDDFSRQMADAQAALQEALAATSLELQGNSEAALRNRDELRSLVDDSVAVIESARDQGRSLDDLKAIRANEIQSLRDQLTQMGYNKEEVESYIDAIERIPLDRTTVLSVDDAKAKLQLDAAIKYLNRQIELNPLSIDVAAAERFAAGPRGTKHAAGGAVFDGDFIVGEAGVPELLRKRGSDVEVIAGAPVPVGGAAMSADLLIAMQQQNVLLAQIAGNTAGPTTGQRLRRVQTTAGAI